MKKVIGYSLKKSIPILISFFPVGIAYGILMNSAGYNWIWTGFTSIFVYAGSLQYLMISFFAGGISLVSIGLMALLLNSRHIFYGLPFIEKWKGIGLLKGITVDEIVQMSENETTKEDPSGIKMIHTSYYSAANLCGIIEEACRIAIRQIQDEGTNQPKPLTREMFEEAFKRIRPGISASELERYKKFNTEDE